MKDGVEDADIAQNIDQDVQNVLGQTCPCVSVIVPTHNSGPILDICLKAVRNQIYPNIEVIIVDDCSKDDTVDIARKYDAKVYVMKSTPSQARNFGIEKSKGKYILILDSDIELVPNIIEECVRKCELKKFDAIHIPVITVGKGFWTKCATFEDFLHIREPDRTAPTFFSRSILCAVGGMDGNLVAGEDWDLWARLKKMHARSTFIKSIEKHHGFINLTNYTRKKYRWYKTFDRYVARHKSFAIKQEVLLLLHWPRYKRGLITRYPQYFFGFLVLKIMRYLVMFTAYLSK